MKLNSLSQDEIKYLKPDELVELLDLLISAEVEKHFTYPDVNKISVPRPITIKDGGEDAQVILTIDDSKINTSKWIKEKFTCFQSKAQKMDDRACKNEVIANPQKRKNKELKAQVKTCFDRDGEYILFTTDSLTEQSILTRIAAIRSALKECAVINYDRKKIKIYDANQIARWANDHISAITFVQKCRGIQRLQPFATWSEWYKMFLIEKKYDYQESDFLKEYSKKLYDQLEKDKVVRVLGHKGLGKTRFVLESFNPSGKSDHIRNLSNAVVYIDLATSQPADLSGFLISHRELEGVIIVDNCPDEWHNSFATPIKTDGNLKLITINDSPPTGAGPIIYLDRKNQKDTVRLIFKNCFMGLTDAQIDHLVSISEGFPEMVSYIDNVLKNSSADLIYSTIPSDFINKFLFGGQNNETEYSLFKACSIFTEFSFYDEHDDEILEDREKTKITNQNTVIHTKITGKPVDANAFYAFCVKYRDKRSLLEKRGLKYSVIPEPIAVNLAAEWWEENRFSYVESLMEELNQNSLLIPMIDRLRSLDQSEKAKGIVSKAWGPNGPFATAEVLNTELGSRLFRSVVEVNPEATAEALEFAFENFSIEELKTSLNTGRRNIVWALEKLVFRDETFDVSAKMLAKLAGAENENYGNNATGQFLQLFHIYLSGTAVNYERRLAIIKWLVNQPELELHELGIRAMVHGLRSHGFVRTIGAENQGFGTTIIEYAPQTWDEIFEYWSDILKLLTTEVVSLGPFKNLAKNGIAKSIRSLFSSGRSSLVKQAIEDVFDVDKSLWEEAIDGLKITFQYETLTDNDKIILNNLISLLSPISIEDQIRFTISIPPWEHDAKNYDTDINQQKAEKFAKKLIETGVQIKDYIYLLVSGEQRQAYSFGAFLAKEKYRLPGLIEQSILQLSKLNKSDQNPTLLAGLISSSPIEEQRKVIDRIINTSNLTHHAFYLTRLIKPEKSDFKKLFTLVDSGQNKIEEFLSFQYGRSLDELTTADVIELCNQIASYNIQGSWTAVLIISQYCYQNDEKWNLCRNDIKNIISYNNFIAKANEIHLRDDYKWAQLTSKLLDNAEDSIFAQIISNQILEAISATQFYSSDKFMADLIKILTDQYFLIFWNTISPRITNSGIEYFNIKALIGSKNGAFGDNGSFFEHNHDVIIKWCLEQGGKASLRIAYMMPIFDKNHWHPFAKKMINTFGDDEKFLDEIAANMGSYGMVGSSIPYYSNIVDLATELLLHPNNNVVKWAKKCIRHYKKQIRREQIQEAERA